MAMKKTEIDINYMSVDDAIKVLQEYAGQRASIVIDLEPVPYEARFRIVVSVKVPK